MEVNLIERCRSVTGAERSDVRRSLSVTRESKAPSGSKSSAGINAESRPNVVTMNMNTRKKFFFLCISTVADGSSTKVHALRENLERSLRHELYV
jgi:hypothetical protein